MEYPYAIALRQAAIKLGIGAFHIIVSQWHCLFYWVGISLTEITGNSIVCTTACPGYLQRKHLQSVLLAHFRRIISIFPTQKPVTRKVFPFAGDILLLCPLMFDGMRQRHPRTKICHNRHQSMVCVAKLENIDFSFWDHSDVTVGRPVNTILLVWK